MPERRAPPEQTTRRDRASPWRGRLASVLAGALPLLAFPEPALWWSAWVALVPLLALLRASPNRREAGLRAWAGGVGFVLALAHWSVVKVGPALVPLAAVFALVWVPWGRVARALLGPSPTGRRLAAALVVLPAGWVVIEYARSWHVLGGPGGLLGTTQWNHPPTLTLAALGGVWLVSLTIVGANVALAAALHPRARLRVRAAALGAAAALVLAGPAWYAVRPAPPEARRLRIALVQPGQPARAEARLAAGEQTTRRAVGRGVDLVVWGESSVTVDLGTHPQGLRRLRNLAAAVGAPLLVNVDARRGRRGIFKSAVLVTPAGVRATYDKMRLVPFGEAIPLRPLLGWIARVSEAAEEDRRRGETLRVFDVDGTGVGPLISFEVMFPDMTRNLARRGAELVAVQSMTSSFQGSWAPEQVASVAAVRAVETGRPVVYATLTGVSAAFDGRGSRRGWLGPDERGVLIVDVPAATERTPFVRFGDVVPAASALALLAALAVRRRRTPSRTRLPSTVPSTTIDQQQQQQGGRQVRGWDAERG